MRALKNFDPNVFEAATALRLIRSTNSGQAPPPLQLWTTLMSIRQRGFSDTRNARWRFFNSLFFHTRIDRNPICFPSLAAVC
jgi:hypothetical protein